MVDGREGYMVQLILGTLHTSWTQRGILPTVEQLVKDTWPIFERKAKSRGKTLADDGRGLDLFKKKAWYQRKEQRTTNYASLQKKTRIPSNLSGQTVDPKALTSPLLQQRAFGSQIGVCNDTAVSRQKWNGLSMVSCLDECQV